MDEVYEELYHHGIKDQKWGVRRFQNSDGSLTAAGRERYGIKSSRSESKSSKESPRKAKQAAKKAAEVKKKRQVAAKKAAETRKKNQAAEEKKELTKEQQELLKKEIISKGDYRKALDNVELFSNSELKELVDRRTQINNLDAFKARERTKFNKGVEKTTEVLNKVSNLTTAALKVYDNSKRIAKIIKGLDGDNSNKDNGKKENNNEPKKLESQNKPKKSAKGIDSKKWVIENSSNSVDSSSKNYEFGKDWTDKLLNTFSNTSYSDASNYKRW